MTILKKKFKFGLGATPSVQSRGLDPGRQTKIMFDILLLCLPAKFQPISLTTALVITKFFKDMTFDRLGKILTLPCLFTVTGQSWYIARSCEI